MLPAILVSVVVMGTLIGAQKIGDGVRKVRQVITKPFHRHHKKP